METVTRLFSVQVYKYTDKTRIYPLDTILIEADSKESAANLVKSSFDYEVLIPEYTIVDYGKVI